MGPSATGQNILPRLDFQKFPLKLEIITQVFLYLIVTYQVLMVSVLISIRYYVANLILFISHTNLNIFFPSNFFSQSVEHVGHDIGLKEKECILKILDIFQVIHQLQVCNKVIFACKSELL